MKVGQSRIRKALRNLQVGALLLLFVYMGVQIAGRLFSTPAQRASLHARMAAGAPPGASVEVHDGRLVAHLPGRGERVDFDVVVEPLAASVEVRQGLSLIFNRAPVERIRIERLDETDVREDRFYQPDLNLLPGLSSIYEYRIPQGVRVPVTLRVSAVSLTPTALTGQAIPRFVAAREDRRTVMGAVMTYSAMSVLAIIMLVLHGATRRQGALAYVWFAMSLLFALMSVWGHLYQLPGLQWIGQMGARGTQALILVALSFAVVLAYEFGYVDGGEQPADAPWLVPAVWSVAGVGAFSAVLMSVNVVPEQLAWPVGTAVWTFLALAALMLWMRAVRNRMPYRWLVLVLIVLAIATAICDAAFIMGLAPGLWWSERALQVTVRALCAGLAISLVRRTEFFAQALESARASEVALRREVDAQTARRRLDGSLEQALATAPDADLGFAASARALSQLRETLDLQTLALLHGNMRRPQDRMVVAPLDAEDRLAQWVQQQQGMLGIARGGADALPNPQPLQPGLNSVLLPLRQAPTGAAILLMERATALSERELALARDLMAVATARAQDTRQARQLHMTANTDRLTGALNRARLDQELSAVLKAAQAKRQPLSVLFVDIDHFKRVNDTHGHAAGDECLRQIARAIQASVRAGDLFGRYGGEEFIVVLPGAPLDAARHLGERIRAAVEALVVEWEGRRIPVTTSVGIAQRLRDEVQPERLLERADRALYAAKRGGRNRVHWDGEAGF